MELEHGLNRLLASRLTRRGVLRGALGVMTLPLAAACGNREQSAASVTPTTEVPTQAPIIAIPSPDRTPSPYDAPETTEIAEEDMDVKFLRNNRNIQIAEEKLITSGGALVIVKVGLHKAQVQIPSLFSRYQPILSENLRDAGYPQRYPLEHNFHAYTHEIVNGNEVKTQWVTAFYGGDGPQATSSNASDVRFLAIGRSDEGYQPYMSITPIAPIAPQLVRLR